MKKIILASLLMLVGSPAFCAVACDPGQPRVTIPGDDTGTYFIRVSFNPVCSANSYIEYTDIVANQKLIAGGVSIKGANVFAGSTLGGSVKALGTPCAANSCSAPQKASDAGRGLTAATSLGT